MADIFSIELDLVTATFPGTACRRFTAADQRLHGEIRASEELTCSGYHGL